MQVAELKVKTGADQKTYRIPQGLDQTVYGQRDTFVDWTGPNGRLWAEKTAIDAKPGETSKLNKGNAEFSLSNRSWTVRKDLAHLPKDIIRAFVFRDGQICLGDLLG